MNEIYNMNLHDRLTMEKADVVIMRVAGGWIYEVFSQDESGNYRISSTFVPFHNEFMGEKK